MGLWDCGIVGLCGAATSSPVQLTLPVSAWPSATINPSCSSGCLAKVFVQ